VNPIPAVEPAIRDYSGWGSALDWAIWITIAVSATILILIVIGRVRYGGMSTELNALWFHLVCLGVLPLLMLIVGNFAALEYSTTRQFCGSCHLTMKAYIDDLSNPKSQSLAGLHFQNRAAPDTECYSCHVNYGLHGTLEAKFTGLRHLYRYQTATYEFPLKMYHPYSNLLCLNCHQGAKRFMAQEIHLENGKVSLELRSGQTECIQCHGPAHEVATPKQAGGPAEGA
jgi:cytochrome c nitrite reductase small subunit